jgi:mannose-6-phosphate isomerase-like protein (cupin superfamily)
MSYSEDAGAISARYRPGGAVTSVTYPSSGTHVRFTAPGSVTNGQYGLFEWNMTGTPGGPGPHFHKTFSESFYITEGTVRLFDGETWVDAVKGDFLYVPQGGIHAFSNESGAPARMLILFAPGAPREEYFEELAAIRSSGRTLTREDWIAVWARHDQYPA